MHLEAGNFGAYKLAIERQGLELASRGVPESHAMASSALYLESCLARLANHGKRKEPAQALVRLFAGTQLFVLAGYASRRAADFRPLDEQERHRLSRTTRSGTTWSY